MHAVFQLFRYIEWSSHQPKPSGELDFDGNFNVFKFLDLAQQNNLSVILRPGPFIDAERDMVCLKLFTNNTLQINLKILTLISIFDPSYREDFQLGYYGKNLG